MKQFLHLLFTLSLLTNLHAQTVTVGSSDADYITNGTNDEIEIQAAIDALAGNNGGTVQLKAQTFQLGSKILPKSNVQLIGMGIDQTILKGTQTHDYLIFNNQTPIDNFQLSALTIDPSNAENASGVRFNYATNCSVSDVKFINVTCNGWHLVLGINGAPLEVVKPDYSRNNLVDNCEFDGHQGSLEMLLVFNNKNTIIKNSTFRNKTRACTNDGNAPVLGLWQRTDSILIENCQFLNNESSEAIYYSSSSFNTVIKDCQFNNTGSIRGANDSDWEKVNELYDYAENLKIEQCDFMGGQNDRTKMAIQLGAVKNALIKDCTIEAYEEGITFQGGFTHEGNGHKAPKHWAVINTIIKNCNPNDDVHGLHGGCLFTEGTDLNGFFICGRIYDDQAAPTMRYPLIFENLDTMIYPDLTYDSIFILGTELSAIAPYNELQFNGPIVRGDALIFEDCTADPAPSFCGICDTPQSMATYGALMEEYDEDTAQKLVALDNLSITHSSCTEDLLIDNQTLTGTYMAHTITTNNSVTVTTQATFKAKDEITLSSGFHAESGSEFLAIIEDIMLEDCMDELTQTERQLQKQTYNQLANFLPIATSDTPAINVYPNPFADQFVLEYFLPTASPTSIYLTNILGEKIWISKEKILDSGSHQMRISIDKLVTGTYFLVLTNGKHTLTRQVIRI